MKVIESIHTVPIYVIGTTNWWASTWELFFFLHKSPLRRLDLQKVMKEISNHIFCGSLPPKTSSSKSFKVNFKSIFVPKSPTLELEFVLKCLWIFWTEPARFIFSQKTFAMFWVMGARLWRLQVRNSRGIFSLFALFLSWKGPHRNCDILGE